MRNLTTRLLIPFSLLALLLLAWECRDSGNPVGNSNTFGSWELVRAAQGTYFHGIDFPDQSNGWAVGDSGLILHSSDGGDSWHVRASGTKSYL